MEWMDGLDGMDGWNGSGAVHSVAMGMRMGMRMRMVFFFAENRIGVEWIGLDFMLFGEKVRGEGEGR